MKMWYIFTMEYYSGIKRNEIGSFVETWMDLESVIQSEVGRKEKNKYCILTYMCNLEKWYRCAYLLRRNRDADDEDRHVDTGRGEGEGGTN